MNLPDDLAVQVSDGRVSLDYIGVVFREPVIGFFSIEEDTCAGDELTEIVAVSQVASGEGFVYFHYQSGHRSQPSEPGVANEQLEECARRRDRSVDFLIERPFGIEQGFVETEQAVPDIDELLPKRVAGRTEEGHALFRVARE